MEYRQIGQTDLKLSAITFGAWAAGGWMWGGTEKKSAIEAIRASLDLGVTAIDTAPIYGQGASEEIVGEAISGIPRDKIQILTKFGMRWDTRQGQFAFKSEKNNGDPIDIFRFASKSSIIQECEDSLRRLQTDYIDLYQIHWPDATTPIPETMEALGDLVQTGKVRYGGVCNYDVAHMMEADKHLSLISNQVPYSMVKREIERELVPYCIENRKAILAYSPLERGLLTGKMKPGHAFAPGDHRAAIRFFTDENIKRVNAFLEKISPLAREKQSTIAQLVLRWTIDQPGITIALAGARDSQQASENAAAIDIKLSEGEIGFINSHLQELILA